MTASETDPIVPVPEGDGTPHPTTTQPEPTAQQTSQMSEAVFAPVVETTGGMRMPRIGLGTFQLDDDTAADMVAAAIEMGYRHIDTAQMYGNESGVGRGIAASGVPTDDLFITTKVDNQNHEPDALVDSVKESLDKLGVEAVDLLLIHWPVEYDRMGATMAALANVHAGGMARHIGVSNFTVEQLDEVKDMAPLEALQVECHPLFRQEELRDWCNQHGWVLTAYSPIAQGAVFDQDTITRIAEANDASPSAVTLAWLTQLRGVCAIPRTSNTDHLRDNLAALELELSDDDLAAIGSISEQRRIVDPDFAPW